MANEITTDTVAFDSDGGAAVTSQIGPDGSSITLPSDTYPGYTFDGWFTASSGGTEVDAAGSSFTVPVGGVTLYAQWTAAADDDYSYVAGGGSGTGPASGNGVDGTTVTLAANPFTYPGYTFAGWSDGTNTYPAGSTYTLASAGNPIVFTAQWTENPLDTVAFNADGGAAVASTSGPDGSSITLPSDSYPGYTFDGWFSAASGGTEIGGAGSPFTIPAGGLTLYAQWTKQLAQTITFAALAHKTLTQSPLTVSATASSGLPVTFGTTTPTICTSSGINGTTITLISAGTCTVGASQAGDSVYKAAPPISRSFSVTLAPQTITFGALANETMAQSPLTVSATASSGLAVTFTTTTATVCTTGGVNGTTITLLKPGTCTVKASQAGNSIYKAAPAISHSFTVSKVSQTITFGALANETMAQSPLTVSATASSGLTVTFTTTTAGVCTAGGIDGTTITLIKAGTCTVKASQAGNSIYKAAPAVSQHFTVSLS